MDPRQLREATRTEHEATEAVMPLMGPGLTRALYAAVLQSLYPLLKSWEEWAKDNAPAALGSLLAARRRSGLLQQDLAALGVELGAAARADVPWNALVHGADVYKAGVGDAGGFEASFLGAVYVMEGSTLGGRFLARHVEETLGFEPGVGDAYFQGHGEATGAMWREVLDHIRAVPEEDAPLVIGAARRTFGAFGVALQAGLPVAELADG